MREIIESTYEAGTEVIGGISLLKEVIVWGDKKFTERRNRVILKFYEALLDGEVTKERIEYEKENIQANEDQFYILLNLAINEEEIEKAFVYANVYKYIRDNQDLEKSLKIFLFKVAKDLPFSAIELLPKIYIHQKYHTKLKNLNDYLKNLYGLNGYEKSVLERHNLTSSWQASFGPIQYSVSEEYFTLVVDAFFNKEDLLPEQHNIEVWAHKHTVILSHDPFGEEEPIPLIKSILTENSIQHEVLTYQNIDFNNYSYIICVVTDANYNNVNNFKFDNLQFNTLIKKVTLSNNFPNSGVLNLNEEEDINKLKEMFSD